MKKSHLRFIYITAIIALGIAFFTGLKATAPSMEETARVYFEETKLADLHLQSDYGFKDSDLTELANVDGAYAASGSYSMDVVTQAGEKKYVTKIMSYPEEGGMNYPELLEGRLPENDSECLIEAPQTNHTGPGIGDTVEVTDESQTADTLSHLKNRTYTVVGVVRDPQYISIERGSTNVGKGTLDNYIIVDASAFDYERYTDAWIVSDATNDGVSPFSTEYDDAVAALQDKVHETGDRIVRDEYDDIRVEANQKIADSEKELADAQEEFDTQIADAQAQIDEGQAQLDDSAAQIAEAEQEYADGKAQLESGEAEYQSGYDTLEQSEAQYEAGRAELDSSQSQLDQKETELADGQTQYEAGLAQYNEQAAQLDPLKDGIAQLDDGIAQADAGIAQLTEGIDGLEQLITGLEQQIAALPEDDPQLAGLQTQLAQAQAQKTALEEQKTQAQTQRDTLAAQRDSLQQQLDEAEALLAPAKQQLEETKAQLDAGREAIEQGKAELEAGYAQLADSRAQLDAGWQTLNDSRAQLDAGWQTLADSRAQLDDGIAQYEEGVAELEDARNELETSRRDGQTQLDDAQQKIDDAKKQVADLTAGKFYVSNRDDNPGYSGYGEDAVRINNVGNVFPMFFLLVAALVAFTTTTRMVEEQRAEIGTLSALGYSRAQILRKYIVYAGLAAGIGSLIGAVFGIWFFPLVIFAAYGLLYSMPALITVIPWGAVALGVGVAFLCTIGAAAAIALYEMRATPAELMQPKAPRPGKRVFLEKIPMLWNRLGFITKISSRNILRYKARFFMTVLGIAGCTALILAGFGLHDSIFSIIPNQFNNIQVFDETIVFKNETDLAQKQDILSYISSLDGVKGVMAASQNQMSVEGTDGGASLDTYVVVPSDPSKLTQFVSLHPRGQTDEILSLESEGAVINEKVATDLGIGIGDTVRVYDSDESFNVTVTGIMENYLQNYVYMSPEVYTAATGKAPMYNIAYVDLTESGLANEDTLLEKLTDREEIVTVMSTDTTVNASNESLSSLNLIVVVMVVSAGILAFIVLYNLTNINISERVREIATLKVLGFYPKETNRYIFRENLVLAVIGMIIGLFLGQLLFNFIILTVETDIVMFGRTIYWQSYIYSCLLTIGFTFIVNWSMIPVINRVDMVEALKSNE